MTSVEDLIKKIYEINQASYLGDSLKQEKTSILQLFQKIGSTRNVFDFSTMIERVNYVLKNTSTLNVTYYDIPALPTRTEPVYDSTQIVTQVPLESEHGGSETSILPSSIDVLIRGIIQRLGFRKTRPQAVVEEPETPKVQKPKEKKPKKASISQYLKSVAAAVPTIAPTIIEPPKKPAQQKKQQKLIVTEQETEIIKKDLVKKPETLPEKIDVTQQVTPSTLTIPATYDTLYPKKMVTISQMGYQIARLAISKQFSKPVKTSTHTLQTIVASKSRSINTVIRRLAQAQSAGMNFTWRPSILEAIGVASTHIIQRTHTGKIADDQSTPISSQIIRYVSGSQLNVTGEDLPKQVRSIIEKQVDRTSVQIATQANLVQQNVSERAAQLYQNAQTKSTIPSLSTSTYLDKPSGQIDQAIKTSSSMGNLVLQKMKEIEESNKVIESIQQQIRYEEKEIQPSSPVKAFNYFMMGVAAISQNIPKMDNISRNIAKILPAGMEDLIIDEPEKILPELMTDTLVDEITGTVPEIMEEIVKEEPISIESISSESKQRQYSKYYEIIKSLIETLDVKEVAEDLLMSKEKTEKIVKYSLQKVVNYYLNAPISQLDITPTPLDTPIPYTSLKLQDIYRDATKSTVSPQINISDGERPIPSFNQKNISQTKPISRVRIDEKDLERKIVRILKEEARRYGVY